MAYPINLGNINKTHIAGMGNCIVLYCIVYLAFFISTLFISLALNAGRCVQFYWILSQNRNGFIRYERFMDLIHRGTIYIYTIYIYGYISQLLELL